MSASTLTQEDSKVAEALAEFYREQKIGESPQERLAFWRGTEYGSGNLSNVSSYAYDQQLGLYEITWLTDHYPEFFSFH